MDLEVGDDLFELGDGEFLDLFHDFELLKILFQAFYVLVACLV